ncbi:hypothetical protein Sru01_34980 [Sphaerisporangium rufum]|uniref:Uncharacterized protein n=1 Tax=Sphaerisporangium rufum TaxID=1381558 RepID=A0A919R2I0_9ACTN|nr:hypothetical protein Sru01_34980 [Sphaerisporangium rufum]
MSRRPGRGRPFHPAGGPRPVVIGPIAADRPWPGRSPPGRRAPPQALSTGARAVDRAAARAYLPGVS